MISMHPRSDMILRYVRALAARFGERAGEVAASQRDQAMAVDPRAHRTWAAICELLG